jgi:hypothetical protein
MKRARLLALEDAIHIAGRATELIDAVKTVREETTAGDEQTVGIDRWQSVPGRQCNNRARVTNARVSTECRERAHCKRPDRRSLPARPGCPSACLCRWSAAHRQQPLCRLRIQRPGTPAGPNSLSMRKKSRTSAWGRSTSSTRSTPARPTSEKRLHSGAEAAEAAGAAAEAEAAAATAAVFRGDIAASVRREHFPTMLTRNVRPSS